MILSWLTDAGMKFGEFFLGLLPQLPEIPSTLHDSLFNYLDIIFDAGSNILSLFIRISTLKLVIPILIVIINADKIYQVIMWIVRKIPLLSMD